MARRRYRSDASSAAGRGVKPDEAAPSGQLPLSSEPPPPSAPAPDTTPGAAQSEYVGGLKSGVDQLRQQQQQHYQPQSYPDQLAGYLASIPGLTIPKFQFLHRYFMAHPDRLNGDHWQLLKAAHGITTAERKIPEDSAEYFAHMYALLNQHQHAAAAPAPAPPAAPPPEPPQPVAHADIETEEPAMANFVSAPVSRGDRGTTIDPQLTPSSIRLTPEQRDIAQRSGISEIEYGRQLLKLERMKTSGLVK